MTDAVKHTPGPWTTHDMSMTGAVWAGDEFIATVYPNAPVGWNGRDEFERLGETRANARLVSAAPDLLAAAKLLLDSYVGLVQSGDCGFWSADKEANVIAARAAIAKAEGRS